MRLLFVCMGNICRSPTAEGMMRHVLLEAGLESRVEVDSAGTGAWHVGDRPIRVRGRRLRVGGSICTASRDR